MKNQRVWALAPKIDNIEEKIDDFINVLSNLELEETRVILSEDKYKKLKELSERLGIPVKYMFLLILLVDRNSSTQQERKVISQVANNQSSVKEVRYYDAEIKVTDDLYLYLDNLKKLKDHLKGDDFLQPFLYGSFTIKDIEKLNQTAWDWIEANKDIVYLDYKLVDKLYEMTFDSYEDFVLHFLFIYAPYKTSSNSIGLYGLNFLLSTEYLLPPSLFSKSSISSWIQFIEPSKEILHLNQEEIQTTLGMLMDSHYLDYEDIDVVDLPDQDWMYEDVSMFKELALNGGFPYNPMLLGSRYKIAPVEVLIPSDVKNIPAETGRKLREFFKNMIKGETRGIWFGKFKNYDLLAFRSGYLVIGNIKNPSQAVNELVEIFYSWLKGRKFKHYTEFFIDKMIASPHHWFPLEPSYPAYNNTSSIAFYAACEEKVLNYWNKVLLTKIS
ncbi:MAG: hypothetical protein DSY42_00285 [Aquifex sp.]|nr:MAG: hypothetical protein DSY42_00285 [Aquifex sp.]